MFSRFRFDIFGKALLLVVPAWSIVSVVLYWSPLPEAGWSHTDVLWFLLATTCSRRCRVQVKSMASAD